MNSHTSFVRWAQLFAEVWMICGLSNHKMAERWRIRVALCIAKKENDLNAELSRLRGEVERLKQGAKNLTEITVKQLSDIELDRIAERWAIAEAVWDITNEHPHDRVTACNDLANRIEKGEVKP